MLSLQRFIEKNVDLTQIVTDLIGPEGTSAEGIEIRGFCPFHEEKGPSFYVNKDNAKWYCHSCRRRGHSLIDLLAQVEDISARESKIRLYSEYIRPIIPAMLIDKWTNELWDRPIYLQYLITKRFISDFIIQKYSIGLDPTGRITIPVYNEYGLCINCRRYSIQKTKYKMISYKKGYGKTFLFPFDQVLNNKEIIITEGELDALALISLGLHAVSGTCGAHSWPKDEIIKEVFRGRHVYICYDNDKSGVEGRNKVVDKLRKVAKVIQVIDVPPAVGKDVTDWIKAGANTVGKWRKILKQSAIILENPLVPAGKEVSTDSTIPLSEAVSDKYYGTEIGVKVKIIGRQSLPFLLPRQVQLKCVFHCGSQSCGLKEGDARSAELDYSKYPQQVLSMAGSTDAQIFKMIRNMFKVRCNKCVYALEHLARKTVEKLVVTPLIGSDPEHKSVHAYYINKAPISNKAYKMKGLIVAHPKDQVTTLYFTSAIPLQDHVETFRMTPVLKDELECFQPAEEQSVINKLREIADWQSRHISKIWDRPELHIVTDLVYHSLRSFTLQSDFVKRGMLDVLVFGDSRTGKNKVCERMAEYYGLGEVASGENTSYAGIVGGMDMNKQQWIIQWGLIPQNHNGMVIIDEMSELSTNEIARLSRIRSEGVAEIQKIHRESCPAMARLLWLSNTRTGKDLSSYNTGVQALRELVGNNEDIARFDLAMSLSKGEVSISKINKFEEPKLDDVYKYEQRLFRSLILWVWSRSRNQVSFTDKAIYEIIQNSLTFGTTYSSEIPLIQSESVRYKIAKLAAAIAGRVFSTEDGEILLVTEEHVRTACSLITLIYNKSGFAYNEYTNMVNGGIESSNLDKFIKSYVGNSLLMLKGIRGLDQLTCENLVPYTGDIYSSRTLLANLVKYDAIKWDPDSNRYGKTPGFNFWLRDKIKELEKNGTVVIATPQEDRKKANRERVLREWKETFNMWQQWEDDKWDRKRQKRKKKKILKKKKKKEF